MSEQQNFGFGKFVPGFDFLQNLSKGASQSQPALPSLTNWVAPTLNVDELEKRISELKAVHFWLDQNSKALGATIQALELQKMTLATLKGMNFNMAEIADALKLKPASGDDAPTGSLVDAATQAVAKARANKNKKNGDAAPAATGVVDPVQWWGALTQQFQEIAASAMKEAATTPGGATPSAPSPNPVTGKAAGPGRKATARKAPASAGKQPRKGGARSR
jgi:hypothetical protein